MNIVFVLLFVFSGLLRADVLIEPRTPALQKEFIIKFLNTTDFPGKVFFACNIDRTGYILDGEITILGNGHLFTIQPDESRPIIAVADSGTGAEDIAHPLSGYKDIMDFTGNNNLNCYTLTFVLPPLNRSIDTFTKVIYNVLVLPDSQDVFSGKVVSMEYFLKNELIIKEEMGYAPSPEDKAPRVVKADVAPDPVGLFSDDVLYIILPLIGLAIFFYIKRKNRKNED